MREGQSVLCASSGFVSQVPEPVQKLWRNGPWLLEQLVWQTVEVPYDSQPPLPSQSPSGPQEVGADCMPVQVPVGSVPPGGTGLQVPCKVGTPQLRQDKTQLATLQQ
jgi:hypothetical protein